MHKVQRENVADSRDTFSEGLVVGEDGEVGHPAASHSSHFTRDRCYLVTISNNMGSAHFIMGVAACYTHVGQVSIYVHHSVVVVV